MQGWMTFAVLAWNLVQDPDPPPPAAPVDLRLSVRAGDPVLVECKGSMVGSFSFGERSSDSVTDFDVAFVDNYDVVDDATRHYEADRYYVRDRTTVDGRIDDSCFNGLSLRLVELNGKSSVFVQGGRRVLQEQLEAVQQQVNSAGLWLDLPQAVAIGAEFDVPMTAFLATVTAAEGRVEDVAARLRRASVDEVKGLATLAGRLVWKEDITLEGVAFRAAYEGEATLAIDLGAGNLQGASFAGSASVSGRLPDGRTASGQARAEFAVTTTRGKPAEQARRARPVFRDVEHAFPWLGVRLVLPSSWAASSRSGDAQMFLRTLDAEPACAQLGLQLATLGTGSLEETMNATQKDLEKQNLKCVAKKVTSPLGRGFSTDVDKEDQTIHTEFFPMQGAVWLVYQLAGPEKPFKAAWKDYGDARNTLRKLER